ncbi:hypothetical protein CDAR_398841 [Caerostris darwini]|uniref:Uncharacterized protein n=1 Tax=Caerostris darwini TaxID=1538125 RepID=A0AAV4V839_9ARAC|nr:hypothetical protein CDAR_398841 [Caerostris darwini]
MVPEATSNAFYYSSNHSIFIPGWPNKIRQPKPQNQETRVRNPAKSNIFWDRSHFVLLFPAWRSDTRTRGPQGCSASSKSDPRETLIQFFPFLFFLRLFLLETFLRAPFSTPLSRLLG